MIIDRLPGRRPSLLAVVNVANGHVRTWHNGGSPGVVARLPLPLSTGMLFQGMRARGIRQLWTFGDSSRLLSDAPAELRAPWVLTRIGDWWIDAHAPAERMHLNIVRTDRSDCAGGWRPFAYAESAEELLAGLGRFSDAIKMLPVLGAGRTGDELIRATTGDLEAYEEPAIDYHENDLGWIRREPPEASAELAAFDVSAMYLGVTGSLRLGTGRPERLEGELAFDKNTPGYWHVSAYPGQPEELPPLGSPAPCWLTTPAVDLLAELAEGEAPPIDAAFVWSDARRVLGSFYERVRAARQIPGLQSEAAKNVYTVTIGRLQASYHKDRPGGVLNRPHWRRSIVAQARANMHRRILRVRALSGLLPLAVNVDELVYELPPGRRAEELRGGLGPAVRPSGRLAAAECSAWRRRRPSLPILIRELARNADSGPQEAILRGSSPAEVV